MKRRAFITGWISVVLVLLVSSAASPSLTVSVGTISSKTGGAAGSLEVGFVPQESWLEKLEGGNDDSSLLVRVNPTTFVVSAAAAPTTGADAELEDPTSGVVHCFGQGTGSPGCEFIHLGSLSDERRALRVNDSTVVIQGLGQDLEDCEVHGKPDPALGFPIDIDTTPKCSSGSPTCDASGTVICPSGSPTCTAGSPRCERGRFGGGGNTPVCEESEGFRQPEAADDVLFVVKGLGAPGATVKRVSKKLCLFAHSTDPIRVNDDTVVFVQPGKDLRFGISGGTRGTGGNALHCGAALDDEIWQVKGLSSGKGSGVKKIKVGKKLGIHLGGSAADRGVRLSDHMVVWASPGPDGHFASVSCRGTCNSGACTSSPCGLVTTGPPTCSSGSPVCSAGAVTCTSGSPTCTKGFPTCNGSTPICGDQPDDGLIVLDLTTNKLKFVTIGTLPANSAGRPLRINDTSVLLIGTGPDQERQEDKNFCSAMPADDEIIVVEGLDTLSPTITRFSGFGFMRRPIRLNKSAAVVFEENHSGGPVAINAHVIQGISGADADFPGDSLAPCVVQSGPPTQTTLAVSPGHSFQETDLTRQDAGVALNCNQLVFWTGPSSTDQQAFLLTLQASPPTIVAPTSPAAGDDWKGVRATRANDSTILYTANVARANVGTRALGALRAASDGTTLTDKRLTLPAGAQGTVATECASGEGGAEGLHIPSGAPVRLSDGKGVVLASGSDCSFSGPSGADDGLIVIGALDTSDFSSTFPTTAFTGSWRSCGAPGCRPVALSGSVAVMGGPGANCDIGERVTSPPTGCSAGLDDDELIAVTGF